MSEITKEVLDAFTESNNRVATALEKLVGNQETQLDKTDELLAKLSNGLSGDLKAVKRVVCGEPEANVEGLGSQIATIKSSSMRAATIVTVAGIVIMVAVAITQFIHAVTHIDVKAKTEVTQLEKR